MGNADTKLSFRKAIVQITSKTQPIEVGDDGFWDQFWSNHATTVQDVYTLVLAAEIRALREEASTNLATLCYKAVEKMVKAVDSSCRTQRDQHTVLNCVHLLTRILPYIFEDDEWRNFFWSSLPPASAEHEESMPLAQSLVNAVCDLLFCPDFTVVSARRSGPDKAEELSALDSCEYIWEAGVGFAGAGARSAPHDLARTDLLRLLLACFSETIYRPPASVDSSVDYTNKWIAYLTCHENRHALPLFTSLLNTVCAYDPVGLGLPYNHLLFRDTLEPLVEVALQILVVTLDHDTSTSIPASPTNGEDPAAPDNLFINYLSRIHRDEDFAFILKGITRLLNNPLAQTYLPNSAKKVQFHQELLILFWKMCDYNKKFMYYVLKSSDVLEVLVPILYHLNDSRADQSRVGLMHIGVFILLLLSGERNFGVRLNKPYTATVPMDIPVFTGSHADLLVVVFHKIVTTGHQRLQPLFDCLLTILVNVSPYLKTLSMVASTKLLHLLEAFSTPWFLFSASNHHHLVFFLLEIFNNIIQYQFDGNSNLVYTIIRKRTVFHSLANLPHEHGAIVKSLRGMRGGRPAGTPVAASPTVESTTRSSSADEAIMEGARPAQPAEPGTLNATLPDTPAIGALTERKSAHPTQQQLDEAQTVAEGNLVCPDVPIAEDMQDKLLSEQREVGDGQDGIPQADTIGFQQITNPSKLSDDKPAITHQLNRSVAQRSSIRVSGATDHDRLSSMTQSPDGIGTGSWQPTAEWVQSWRSKLPLQTIMRLLQVLVPQVEKICIDKGLTDESEILRFLQHGTLVGLLPVPHPILIRKYQASAGTAVWFRTYMWGVIYLRNVDPPVWYDTDVKLFEIQRV